MSDKDLITELLSKQNNENIYDKTVNRHIEESKNYFEAADIYKLENTHWVMQYRYLILKHFITNNMIVNGSSLDLGLGSGLLSNYINKLSGSYLGLDKDIHVLNYIQEKYDLNVDLVNIENMRITDFETRFDNIFALNILELITDDDALIYQMEKLLNDNGKILMSIPNETYKEDLIDIKNQDNIKRLYNLKEIEDKLNHYKLKIDYVSYYKNYTNLSIVNALNVESISQKVNKIEKGNFLKSLKNTIGETLINKDLIGDVAYDEDIMDLSVVHPENAKILKIVLKEVEKIKEGTLKTGQEIFIVASKMTDDEYKEYIRQDKDENKEFLNKILK